MKLRADVFHDESSAQLDGWRDQFVVGGRIITIDFHHRDSAQGSRAGHRKRANGVGRSNGSAAGGIHTSQNRSVAAEGLTGGEGQRARAHCSNIEDSAGTDLDVGAGETV